MNQYYLLSQLPSLESVGDTGDLPIKEGEFYELCQRFLSDKSMKILSALSLCPKKELTASGSGFVDSWNRNERLLRLALAGVRAEKMNKPFESALDSIPVHIMQAANTAVNMDSPLAAEQYLSEFRLSALDGMRPFEQFSEENVFYYAIRLKLLERMRLFNAEKGRASYEKIYSSILNRSEQES